MKALRLIMVCFIAMLLIASGAPLSMAHGGGTDSEGGHVDHSTGEYHYHHGHPAHDHTDMDGDGDLDCPYSFTDATDRNRNSSSVSTPNPTLRVIGTPHVYTKPSPYTPRPTPATPIPTYSYSYSTDSINQKSESSGLGGFAFVVVSMFSAVCAAIGHSYLKTKNKELDNLNAMLRSAHQEVTLLKKEIEKLSSFNSRLAASGNKLTNENQLLNNQVNDLQKSNQSLRDSKKSLESKLNVTLSELNSYKKDCVNALFSQNNIKKVCKMPSYAYIGEDGLPAGHGDRKWGKYYTFYCSSNGSCYHDDYLCSGATIPINAIDLKGLKPCGKCKPVLPDLNWYYNLKMMENLLQQVSNAEKNSPE